jgi:hypothetical protein
MMFTAWLMLAVTVALIAIEKRRNGVRWFIYGMLAWPMALPHALLASRLGDTRESSSPRS